MGSSSVWQRFQNYFLRYDDLDFSVDISRMKFPDGSSAICANPENVFHVLRHLTSNDSHVRVSAGGEPADDKFSLAK
jgi:hypothetical protein